MKIIAKKIHKDRDEILNFCSSHKKIFMFGAGFVGEMMWRYLLEEEIEVSSILVSAGFATTDSFHGIPVKEFYKNVCQSGDGIIVAVDDQFRKEIFTTLIKFGVNENDIYIQRIYSLPYKGFLRKDTLLRKANVESKGFFEQCRQLDELGKKFNTDKSSSYHNYLMKYEFFLQKLKDAHINILELGVFNGSSLKVWEEYFKNAQIYGIDIDERCRKYSEARCHVIIQDLGDEELLSRLSNISPSIIIDDASHYTSHQIKALYHLFPILQPGGIFIMEDLGTNFNLYKDMGLQDANVSCYEFCRSIADAVASGEYLSIDKMIPSCVVLKDEIEFLAREIDMICFIHESCIIIKK